jgi:hypothetical protein
VVIKPLAPFKPPRVAFDLLHPNGRELPQIDRKDI